MLCIESANNNTNEKIQKEESSDHSEHNEEHDPDKAICEIRVWHLI